MGVLGVLTTISTFADSCSEVTFDHVCTDGSCTATKTLTQKLSDTNLFDVYLNYKTDTFALNSISISIDNYCPDFNVEEGRCRVWPKRESFPIRNLQNGWGLSKEDGRSTDRVIIWTGQNYESIR